MPQVVTVVFCGQSHAHINVEVSIKKEGKKFTMSGIRKPNILAARFGNFSCKHHYVT